MDCDMCGSKPAMFRADVEGGELNLCNGCSRYGKILGRVKAEVKVKQKAKQDSTAVQASKIELIQVIANDYASRIRMAREKLGMKQQEFAKLLSEKESVIHKIETGVFEPSLSLARKLEKRLNIKLIEQHEEKSLPGAKKGKKNTFTLGDVIKIRER